MPNIVFVFFVEFIIGNSAERLSPESNRLFNRETEYLSKV